MKFFEAVVPRFRGKGFSGEEYSGRGKKRDFYPTYNLSRPLPLRIVMNTGARKPPFFLNSFPYFPVNLFYLDSR